MKSRRVLSWLLILLLLISLFCGCQPKNAGPENDNGRFDIYFLDVGQADSSLIICDGEAMLIDGGNTDDAKGIISNLKKKGVSVLEYVVGTHGHEDHIGGLSKVIDTFTVKNVLYPETSYTSSTSKRFINSAENKCGLTVCHAGDSFKLGSADVNVVWAGGNLEGENNSSIVLKITYNKISVLFTGDIEKLAESNICNEKQDISASLLKVAHHGSSSSTGYAFLRSVMPDIAVISCGENNSYGHPHKETLDILNQADVAMYRTDLVGEIHFTTDGESLLTVSGKDFTTSTNARFDRPGFDQDYYVGNVSSKKFHTPQCANLPKEKNRVYFTSREEAIKNGYSPCSACGE